MKLLSMMTLFQNVQERCNDIQLRVNEACTSFNISAEPCMQEEPDRTTTIVHKDSVDETVKYDDLVSCQNVQKICNDIRLRVNEA